ncbi:MAG TPA: NADH-ubiquinone oxidoreductase-F iron-sulfur binding region domain-containing protein [Candidatus Saccharimonadales bacterium]|nr:NADH-ubiquinone oxidoreductase-F iron-sulfur binding region domain-containing protein [Candidatus Saccharimonadales bacterium]
MQTITTMQRLLPDARTPESLDAHVDVFGPRPVVDPRTLIEALDESGLRGRGGAGFPTGTKWRAVMQHANGAGAVVIANAAEREPASHKDRTLMLLRPHLVLDGLEHAAETLGARRAIVYTSRADDDMRRTLQAAITERRQVADTRVFIEVATGPNRYVAGEETALIARVSGRLAKPRVVPPRPYENGVDGIPTLVQNVETLAHAALIARRGASWFRSVGTTRTPGTALVSVTGAVASPGVFETDATATVGDLAGRAGGVIGEPSAVMIGGYSGRWVTAAAVMNVPIDIDSLRSAGASLGAGILAFLPVNACGVVETDRVLTYLASESARQCGPCHVGLPALADTFHHVATGRARPAALDTLLRWSGDVLGRGACQHPDGAARFLMSALQVFGADLRHHLRNGACRYSGQPPLLPIPESEAGWW